MTMVDTVSHPRTEDAPRVLVTFTVKSDRKTRFQRVLRCDFEIIFNMSLHGSGRHRPKSVAPVVLPFCRSARLPGEPGHEDLETSDGVREHATDGDPRDARDADRTVLEEVVHESVHRIEGWTFSDDRMSHIRVSCPRCVDGALADDQR